MGLVRQLLIVALLCGLGVAAYRYGWPLIDPATGNAPAPGHHDGSCDRRRPKRRPLRHRPRPGGGHKGRARPHQGGRHRAGAPLGDALPRGRRRGRRRALRPGPEGGQGQRAAGSRQPSREARGRSRPRAHGERSGDPLALRAIGGQRRARGVDRQRCAQRLRGGRDRVAPGRGGTERPAGRRSLRRIHRPDRDRCRRAYRHRRRHHHPRRPREPPRRVPRARALPGARRQGPSRRSRGLGRPRPADSRARSSTSTAASIPSAAASSPAPG